MPKTTVPDSLKTILSDYIFILAKFAFILDELDTAEFDERDLNKLRGNDAEAELYLRLFIRSRQGDLEKAYNTMVHTLKNYTVRPLFTQCVWLLRTNQI